MRISDWSSDVCSSDLFVLGTDAVGRDMLSRLIHGARYSLYVGTIVIVIAFSAGITLGLIAGFFRGTVETLIARSMDIILAFPSILLALVLEIGRAHV